jgi:hypothetical protein
LLLGSAIFWLSIVILIPLGFVKKIRGIVGAGFILASWYFGMLLWIASLITVYTFWGGIGVFIGFFFAAIGMIPEAFIAAILNTDWSACGNLLGFLLPTLIFFGIGFWLISKDEKDNSLVVDV